MSHKTELIWILFIWPVLFACSGGEMDKETSAFTSLKEVPKVSWKKLSDQRIYFGHQSVGNNILRGIQEIMKENPQVELNIFETNNPEAFNAPVFGHSSVGKNMDPKSKCDAFSDYLENGLGGKVDIAFFKFCFVDVTAATDVENLFKIYRNTLSELKQKYPKTTFVHVTVPLMTIQTGIKAGIKKIIGRPIGGYDDNAQREEFNNRLRREYEGKEPLFDLARWESTSLIGVRVSFEKNGKTYFGLVPEYTNDGGHLNQTGRKLVAEQLLILLAAISK